MAGVSKSNPYDLSDFESRLDASLNRVQTDPEFVKEITSEKQGNPITLGPPVIDAAEWAAKQVKNATAAAGEWLKNVKRPRRDPLASAIAAGPKRAEKVRQSLEEKKWEKAMAKVDEDLMYRVIDAGGAEVFRKGVEMRRLKVAARVAELQPMVTALKKEIEAMPDVTDADREARLLAARRGMIAIGKKRRGL